MMSTRRQNRQQNRQPQQQQRHSPPPSTTFLRNEQQQRRQYLSSSSSSSRVVVIVLFLIILGSSIVINTIFLGIFQHRLTIEKNIHGVVLPYYVSKTHPHSALPSSAIRKTETTTPTAHNIVMPTHPINDNIDNTVRRKNDDGDNDGIISSSSNNNTNNNTKDRSQNNTDDNNNNNDDDKDMHRFIAPFVKQEKYTYQSTNPTRCDYDTTILLLEEWKHSSRKTAFNYTTSTRPMRQIRIDEYVLQRWENQPTIRRYYPTRSENNPVMSKVTPFDPVSSSSKSLWIDPTSSFPFKYHNSSDIIKRDSSTSNRNGGIAVTDNGANNTTNNHTPIITTINATTILRIALFDTSNSYERFHAYINVALIMIMFDIRNPQLLLLMHASNDHQDNANDVVDNSNKEEKRQYNPRDHEMWTIFSIYPPLYYDVSATAATSSSSSLYRYNMIRDGNSSATIIDVNYSGLSMINTKVDGPAGLNGRGVPHHCTSILFRAIIDWMTSRFHNNNNDIIVNFNNSITNNNNDDDSSNNNSTYIVSSNKDDTDASPNTTKNNNTHTSTSTDLMTTSTTAEKIIIQVLWSSRGPYYCCNNQNQKKDEELRMIVPNRSIQNETQFLIALQERLNNNNNSNNKDTNNNNNPEAGIGIGIGRGVASAYYYNITSVNFGTLSTQESIRVVQQSNIMVGVHGAGLIWSAFLRQQQQQQQTPIHTTASNLLLPAGLVEIFAGDRNPTNYHYHNIISLVGGTTAGAATTTVSSSNILQYRATKFWSGSNKYIQWKSPKNYHRIDEVVTLIRSI